MNRNKEALAILEQISITDNSSQTITTLGTLIGRKAKNEIVVSYINVSYKPEQLQLHYGYLEFAHKFSKSAFVGRANVGHGSNNTQLLFEADYYQTISKKKLSIYKCRRFYR